MAKKGKRRAKKGGKSLFRRLKLFFSERKRLVQQKH